MIGNEFKRLMKARSTLVATLLLVIIAIPSFILSLAEKAMFEQQLIDKPEGINLSVVEEFIAEYAGGGLMLDFYYLYELFWGFCILLILWVGIFLSVAPQSQKESGHGNFIVSRMTHKKYLRAQLAAQSLCIACVVAISTALILVLAFFMGGMRFGQTTRGLYTLSAPSVLLITLAQSMVLIILLVLMNAISALLNIWIKNKYVIQALPLCAFTLVPFILGSTIANLPGAAGQIGLIFVDFIPFQVFSGIYTSFHEFSYMNIVRMLLPLAVYAIAALVLFQRNKKVHRESYL